MNRLGLLCLSILAGFVPPAVPQQDTAAALLEQGRALERAGRRAEAQALYERASREYPEQPAFHFKLGRFAMEEGAWPKAIGEFEACLRSFPGQPDTMLLLAEAYEKNGQAERALATVRRAAEAHPEHPGACRRYGMYLCRAGKCGDGLGWLLKAKKLRPEMAGIDYDLGVTYSKLNQWARAQSSLEAALARQPDDLSARFLLAEVCRRTRDWDKARANYERALAAGKRDAATYYGLGASLTALGRYEAAVPALEQAYRLDPSLPAELHFLLGKSLAALGRKEEAQRELTLRERLTDIASAPYRFTTAGNAAEQGLWRRLGQLLAQGREDEALAAIRSQAPGSNPRYLLGAAYFVLGRIPEAARNVRSALAREPNLAGAHAYLGKILLAAGDLDGAEAEVRRELAHDSQNPLGLATLGEVRFAQGRWSEAAESIEAAHTRDAGALLKLCEAYFRLGRKADALLTADIIRALAQGDQKLLAEIDALVSRGGGR